METKKSIIQIAKKTKSKNQSEREVYANYVELGMCTTCHKQAAEDGSTRCGDCNELRKMKFFAPRTEETRVTVTISVTERNKIILDNLKTNKILFKKVDKGLYQTTKKITFVPVTITLFKHSITKGIVYRIRNETKIVSDFYVGLFPEDNSIYVIPNPKPSAIYFNLEEVEQYRDAYSSL